MYPLPQRRGVRSRTINTVAEDLNKSTTKHAELGAHFLNCRYDPFSPTPVKNYVPDGRGKNVVVRDIKIAHEIEVATGEIMNVQILPMLPFPVRFCDNAMLTVQGTPTLSKVDGTALGGNTTAPNMPSTAIRDYLGVVFPNTLKSGGDPSANGTGETGNITGARITTLGYRLMYTGPASAAQGVIMATDIGWSIDGVDAGNIGTLYQWKTTPTALAAAPDTIAANSMASLIAAIPSMKSTTSGLTNQIVKRPENGIRGVLKMQSSADNHVFQPWYENGILVSASTAAALTPINVLNTSVHTTGYAEQNLADPALGGVNLRITGTGTYRLEVAICFEQDLSFNNALVDMGRPSPMLNRSLLDVDMVLNSSVHPAALNEPIIDMSSQMKNMSMAGRPNSRKPNKRRGRKPKQQQRPTNITVSCGKNPVPQRRKKK